VGALGSYATLLAVPLVLLVVILAVGWRQDRRRRWTRTQAPGLRKHRWGHGSLSRRLGQPERHPPRQRGTGAGEGPDDRPTYLD
jgi:hypothetical protein